MAHGTESVPLARRKGVAVALRLPPACGKMRGFAKLEAPTPMPFMRTTLVHKLSRLLMAAMLFTLLGASLGDLFEHGHGGDFQKVAGMVCDEPSDGSDLQLFVPTDSGAPPCGAARDKHRAVVAATPIQAIYSPPPRPPAYA